MASILRLSILCTLVIVLIAIQEMEAKKVIKEYEVDEETDIEEKETEEKAAKKKKKSSFEDDDDDPDVPFRPPEATGRKDCIDDDELEDCTDECNDNSECRRTKHSFECEERCEELCKYMEMNIGKKCVLNLTGGLAEYRFGRVHAKRRGGRRG